MSQDVAVADTPIRTFRADDALWGEARRIASERRETLSSVLVRALVEYVLEHGGSVKR